MLFQASCSCLLELIVLARTKTTACADCAHSMGGVHDLLLRLWYSGIDIQHNELNNQYNLSSSYSSRKVTEICLS